MPVAVPVIVALQIGVGSPSAPAANCIDIVRIFPETVPLNVPLLFRWHELQDPSAGSGAFVRTVPVTVLPVWETVQSTTVVPCESVLVPLHEPATLRIWLGTAEIGLGAVPFDVPVHATNTHTPANSAAAAATRQRADMILAFDSPEPALRV